MRRHGLYWLRCYNATDGANWTDKTNWLSKKPIGEWHGVTTDSDGRVTRLILSGNNLNGSIQRSWAVSAT